MLTQWSSSFDFVQELKKQYGRGWLNTKDHSLGLVDVSKLNLSFYLFFTENIQGDNENKDDMDNDSLQGSSQEPEVSVIQM